MSRMDQALCLVLTLSSKQYRKQGLIPVLFMRTPRCQESTVLVEVHTACQWKSQIVNTDVLDTKAPKKPLHCTTQYANLTPLTTLLGMGILYSLFHLCWEGESSRAGLLLLSISWQSCLGKSVQNQISQLDTLPVEKGRLTFYQSFMIRLEITVTDETLTRRTDAWWW